LKKKLKILKGECFLYLMNPQLCGMKLTLERELLYLKKMSYLSSEASATEDAAIAMMESMAKKIK